MPTEIEILNCLINIKGFTIDSESVEFDKENKTVKFWLISTDPAICDKCGRTCTDVKDRSVRKYRDLQFGIWTAEIWIHKRRLKCPCCGVISERVPFADQRSKYTRRFELAVFIDTVNEPLQKVSTKHSISWDSVLHIERKYLSLWEESKGAPKDVKWLGIDEVCFGKKNNLYTVISDLKSGEILGLVSGNSTSSIDSYFKQVGETICNGIEAVCVDMWKAFTNSVKAHCPNAKIIYDKFHIMRHLNNAVDEVRRQEFFRKGGEYRDLMRGNRWLLLRRWFNLTSKQKGVLKNVFSVNRKISKAHYLKEIFGYLWNYKSRIWAERFLEKWHSELKWQRLKPFEKFYKMIQSHIEGILNYCEIKVPLGLVENINGKIKILLRRTRGFLDDRHFALRLMFMTDSTKHHFLSTFHT